MDVSRDDQAPSAGMAEPPRFQSPPTQPHVDDDPPGEDEHDDTGRATEAGHGRRRWWRRSAGATKYMAGLVVAAVVAFLAGVYLPEWFDRTRVPLELTTMVTPDEEQNFIARVYDTRVTAEEFAELEVPERGLHAPPGGVQALTGNYQIMARNVRQSRVVVVGMRAKIVGTRPAPSGTAVYLTREGAPEPVVRVGFDLDSPDLRARVIGDDDRLTERAFFSDHDLPFDPGDTARFVVAADATKQLYEWRVQIDVFVDGGVESVLAPTEDQPPFRTSGFASSYQVAFSIKGAVDPTQFCVQFAVCGTGGRVGW
jgi:hypothetical protein